MAYFQKYRRGGYGITSKDIRNRVVKYGIEKILDCAPHFKEEVLKQMEKDGYSPVEYYIRKLDDYFGGNAEFALIREAIFEQEGIIVSAFIDLDGITYLVYDYVPMSKEDDSIPNETINAIINKYVNIVFGQDVQCDYHYEK